MRINQSSLDFLNEAGSSKIIASSSSSSSLLLLLSTGLDCNAYLFPFKFVS